MTFHRFRSRLRAGEVLLGSIVSLPVAASAEILADAGFDWLFLDAEHGPLGTSELLSILQAVDHRIPCLVRLSDTSERPIKQVLDMGAAGIIAPQVNSAEEAAAVVRYARYAPDGERGVGVARAHGYGFGFQEYVESANSDITVVVQAEHVDAVENIETIVKVPGVDAVLLGPYDLSASLGKMGQINDPVVRAAIDRVTKACRDANMPLGYFGLTAEAIRPFLDAGYTLIVGGVDSVFLGSAARLMLGEMRDGR